jgi:hypothetical protein
MEGSIRYTVEAAVKVRPTAPARSVMTKTLVGGLAAAAADDDDDDDDDDENDEEGNDAAGPVEKAVLAVAAVVLCWKARIDAWRSFASVPPLN